MNKPIATPSRTREITEKWQIHARKGYGQNFLIDPSVSGRIADTVAGECAVIEIGPGIGALTEQLAQRCAFVRAYEIDADFLPVLADTLSEYNNVEVIHRDFLKVDLDADLSGLKEKYGDVRAAGNLPYYITTPVLFQLFEAGIAFSVITAMMQREVADRFAAEPGDPEYGAISVESRYLYDVEKLLNVPASSFRPVPNVDSAVVVFRRKETIDAVEDMPAFFSFVKACFKQRRKTLYNNLREYFSDAGKAEKVLTQAGISPSVRAQELSVEAFLKLYRSSL